MKFLWLLLGGLLVWPVHPLVHASTLPPVQTVFVIVLENTSWADVKSNAVAPYINQTLLPLGAHCEQYYCPTNIHPSLPNYLWLEAGTNFGILNDDWPVTNHLNCTNHLVSQLDLAGISWRAYAEDIDGLSVPLRDTNKYAVRHVPFLYFDDVTGTNDSHNAYAIAHVRPYTELAGDLISNTTARYNFITPNLIHDGHDVGPPESNAVQQVDDWLAAELPKIFQSPAYTNNGAIFILWDEGSGDVDGPIGLIALSPLARTGYSSSIRHTHSATLRTMQEIFNVRPWLGNVENCADLSELFNAYSLAQVQLTPDRQLQFTLTGTAPGQTNILQGSGDLIYWDNISTNVSISNEMIFTNTVDSDRVYFFRCRVWP